MFSAVLCTTIVHSFKHINMNISYRYRPACLGLDPLLVAGQLFSFSTLMLLVGYLTCKTVSRMTYTVLVETLNPTHSLSSSTPSIPASPVLSFFRREVAPLDPARVSGGVQFCIHLYPQPYLNLLH